MQRSGIRGGRCHSAIIERDPHTGLFVRFVPEFPGAHSQGVTLDELNRNLQEVIAMLLLNASEVELLRAFTRQHVHFLVIGGHAVMFHGYLRPAKGLDLFVESEGENPARLTAALSALHMTHPDLNAERLSRPNQQIRVNGIYHTELLTSVAGLLFQEAFAACAHAQVEELRVPVVGLNHLLESKRALGRPQDLEDIAALQRLQHAL